MQTNTAEHIASDSVDIAPNADSAPLIRYEVTLEQIREWAGQYSALAVPGADYKTRRKAIAVLRGTSVDVEKRRKDLKAGALEYGRRVDGVAKQLTAAIDEVRDPLEAAQDADDAERDRVKREVEEAARARVEAELRVKIEAEAEERRVIEEAQREQERVEREAREAAEAEARAIEQARLDAERAALKAEQDALTTERARVAEEQRVVTEQNKAQQRAIEEAARVEREHQAAVARVAAERLAAERAQLEQERRELAEQQAEQRRQGEERAARELAEREAALRAERARVAAEAEARRVEALRPDVERLREYAEAIKALQTPAVTSPEAIAVAHETMRALDAVADRLLAVVASVGGVVLSLAQHLAPWHTLPIAVLDFETTGPDPATCLPVELAVVRVENGEPVERYSALINPGVPIPDEATKIHGITDAMVADATDARSAWAGAVRLLLGAVPCAYNQSFDRTILHRLLPDALDGAAACSYLELETAWPWLDPLVVVRHVDRFVRGTGRHKLTAVCERRGIALDGAHRATADAEAAGRVLFSADVRAALGDATISEVLRRQTIRAAEQDADFAAWLAKQPKREDATP